MNRSVSFAPAPMTPIVKKLLILNVAIWFFFQVILQGFMRWPVLETFALRPNQVLYEFKIWQLFSYMFLHSMQVSHIVFNMLMLWFFGAELEQRWGKRFFLIYYISCGVGAAILYCLGIWGYTFFFDPRSASIAVPVIGASGAIFGLLLAHGILFGERVVYFFMIFPMKTKVFVALMGLIELASMMTASANDGEVAYLAHLGGIIAGFICLQIKALLIRYDSRRKSKAKGRKLHLVVNNETKSEKPPRYWN